MTSVGSITSTTQAVHTATAVRKVLAASNAGPTRDADGDSDHSPPGANGIFGAGKGGLIDVYA